jgi:histidine ammonia-lyase
LPNKSPNIAYLLTKIFYDFMIFLNGKNLSIETVMQVCRNYELIDIEPEAIGLVQKSRNYIEKQVQDKKIIYGVTTGFGSNASKVIDDYEMARQLQKNLLLSHAVGVGEAFSAEIVRAIMLIRLNTLLAGFSGVRLETVNLLKNLINLKIHPFIPSQGSVGASGDLCPLAHMALTLIGEGKAEVEGKLFSSKEALQIKNLEPIQLQHKEGIALLNGTSVMTALGAIAVADTETVLEKALVASTMAFEAICARKQAFDERVHLLRNHTGQVKIAAIVRENAQNSTLFGLESKNILSKILSKTPSTFLENLPENFKNEVQEMANGLAQKFSPEIYRFLPYQPEKPSFLRLETLIKFAEKKITPQDSYSVRCTPQVLGATLDTIENARKTIGNELNAVVDNPIIFVEDDEVLSAGNFHGQPLALALDFLKLGIAEMGNLLERQINKLTDEATNDCLPAFLVKDSSGLHSGLMIPQYVAASLVSENKVLVHPASADSIPTCANQEDHVSMGTIAGRQALEMLGNIKKIVAILMLTAFQAVSLRKIQLESIDYEVRLGIKTQILFDRIQKTVGFIEQDRWLYEDIEKIMKQELTF